MMWRGERKTMLLLLLNAFWKARQKTLGLYSSYGAIASIVTQGSEGRLRKGALVAGVCLVEKLWCWGMQGCWVPPIVI